MLLLAGRDAVLVHDSFDACDPYRLGWSLMRLHDLFCPAHRGGPCTCVPILFGAAATDDDREARPGA